MGQPMEIPTRAGCRSLISRLPRAVRDDLRRRIREGATTEELMDRLRAQDIPVSRSAVGRYRKQALHTMRRYEEAQDIADIWIRELRDQPGGNIGRLAMEALRLAAFNAAARKSGGDPGDPGVDAREIALLARALRDLEAAGESAERRSARQPDSNPDRGGSKPSAARRSRARARAALRRIRQEVYGLDDLDDLDEPGPTDAENSWDGRPAAPEHDAGSA